VSSEQACLLNTPFTTSFGFPVIYYTRSQLQPPSFDLGPLVFDLFIFMIVASLLVFLFNYCRSIFVDNKTKEKLIVTSVFVNLLLIFYVVVNVVGEPWLVNAVKYQKFRSVKLLLLAGVSANSANANGNSFALKEAALLSNVTLVSQLLASGADPRITDKAGISPLHIAVKKNSGKIIKLLLKNGFDPNLRDKDGKAPLHYACSLDSVKLLLASGANPEIKDKYGKLAQEFISNQDAVKLLSNLTEKNADKDQMTAKELVTAVKKNGDSTQNSIKSPKLETLTEKSVSNNSEANAKKLSTSDKSASKGTLDLKQPTKKLECTTSIGGSLIRQGKSYSITKDKAANIIAYKGGKGFVFAQCEKSGYFHLLLQTDKHNWKTFTNITNNKDKNAPLLGDKKQDLIINFDMPTGKGELRWYFSTSKISDLVNAVNSDKLYWIENNKLIIKEVKNEVKKEAKNETKNEVKKDISTLNSNKAQ